MNLAAVFVRHRVMAYMLNAAIILFGAIAARGIGTDRMPSFDPPALAITTAYPGASPEVMDSSVTSVIESAVNTVSGIDTIESVSRPSNSRVFVRFLTTKDPDVAFNETQSKVNQVLNDLPREAERPVIVKLDPNESPVIRLFITGDRSLSELSQLATEKVMKSLESISGVGEVVVGGGRERKIRVDLNLDKLSALGLTAQDIIQAFGREHVQLPGGYLVGNQLEKLLYLDLEYHSIEELGELVVVSRDQVPVKLKDIAELTDGLADKRATARLNGREGVVVSVRKVQSANTVAIVEAVEAKLERDIRPLLPAGVELLVATNESDIISAIISALNSHLLEGTVLAGVVVLFFLLNGPATLIISTAIPVSLAGALMVMYFAGFTVNMLTMSALLLLIGVVVDDAIVVLENIHRQHEVGDVDTETAAIQGTKEVILPVMAASLTLLCIFGTVIFMEGMVGIFMRSFAVVVSVGVTVSLFVSLTLTPALCASFLKAYQPPQNIIAASIEAGHRWTERNYARLLTLCLQRRALIMLLSLAIVASSGWFISQLGAEFFPEDDESRFQVHLKTPLGSSIDYMTQKLVEVEAIVQQQDDVIDFLSVVGSRDSEDVNEAMIHVLLSSKGEREISQREIMASTRNELTAVAGVDIFVEPFPMFAAMSSSSFEASITGPELSVVASNAEHMFALLKQQGGMGDLRLNLELSRPQLTFDVDRSRAQAMGISAQQIGDTVRVLAGGADIAKYNSVPGDGERHDIRVAAQRGGMRDVRDIENVYLKGSEGDLLPLAAVVDVQESIGPAMIERRNLQYSAGFSSTPEVALDEAVRIFSDRGREILPPGYGVEFSGQAGELGKTGSSMLFVFVTGLILVYMVLASQFNSFLQPVLIMLAQPLAIVGGVFGLWLAGHTLSIFSMIGLVLLVGLVSKNSILLVDLINQYRRKGMTSSEAILQACPRRMRPVLMTSMTIVLAMLPAAIGLGAGGGQYGPLAVAIIGGVVSSTLLTLVVVPVAYSLLDRWLKEPETATPATVAA
jgi:HAE1 family hydrophobic/amphiphilic exporter-1